METNLEGKQASNQRVSISISSNIPFAGNTKRNLECNVGTFGKEKENAEFEAPGEECFNVDFN